jgi:hypothetical protein
MPTIGCVDIYDKPLSGGGQEELLLRGGGNTFPMDWSSDGQWIVYREDRPTTGRDLWLLPLEGDRKPIPYLQTPFVETSATFAPGFGGAPRWMAYQSNESPGPDLRPVDPAEWREIPALDGGRHATQMAR